MAAIENILIRNKCQKVFIHTKSRVTDAVAGVDQYFLKLSEGPFSHDAGHICPEHIQLLVMIALIGTIAKG